VEKVLDIVTGTEDKWMSIVGNVYQSTEHPAVFKIDNKPYFLDAISWKEKNGAQFCGTVEGISSSQYIKSFPFTPKTFTIVVNTVATPEGGKNKIAKKGALKEVWEYYDKFEMVE
jgi:hypothetical protein